METETRKRGGRKLDENMDDKTDYMSLEVERERRIARIWMNRPGQHNAFDEALIDELASAFAELDADEYVRVIVLGGRGKSFCAGADLEWMGRAARYGPEENLRDARALAAMFRTIKNVRKPVIARVQGAALGGGVGLMAVCDVALVSTEAYFALSEVRLGLIPATIAPYVIQAIGPRQAQRYFLSAERFDAAEACRIGLAHEACLPDRLDARVERVAASLANGAPRATAAAKRLIADLAGAVLDDALIDDTAQRIAELRTGDEAREGIGAFLERRRPRWVS